MEHLLVLASECRCLINRRYKTFVNTLHYALENGTDLYVNQCQKIQHYRARSAEGRRRRRRRKRRRRKKKKEEEEEEEEEEECNSRFFTSPDG